MIQIYINDSLLDTYSNTGLGITYQSANLYDLNLRGGHFTNKFKIPLTSRNKSVLENAHIVNSDTGMPYQQNTCTIVMDGVEVLSEGYITIESTTDDEIILSVLSGSSDFFSLVSNANLNDLDFSEYAHDYITDDVVSYIEGGITSGLIYPLANWNDGDGNINNEYGYVSPNIGDAWWLLGNMLPAVYVSTLFEKIADYTGWSITGDLLNDSFFNSLVFTCNRFLKPYDDTNINTITRAGAQSTVHSHSSSLGGSVGNFARTDITVAFDDYDSSMTITNALVLCNKTANYEMLYDLDFELTIPIAERTAYAFRWCEVDSGGTYVGECAWRSQNYDFFYDSGEDLLNTTTGTEVVNVKGQFKATYYFEDGKYYKPFLYYTEESTGSSGAYTSYVKMNTGSYITFNETSTICPLDTVDCTELYDFKIKDFLKDIIKMFGVNLQANSVSKELQFNLFENISDSGVEDWTSKVAIDKGITLTYKHGSYAQTNYLKFKNEENEDAESFTINDTTLELENVAVETSVDVLTETYNYIPSAGGNHTIAKARIFDIDERFNQSEENSVTYYDSQGWLQKIESENCYFMRISTTTPTSGTHRLAFLGFDDLLASPELLSKPDLDTSIPLAIITNVNFTYFKANYYTIITQMLDKVKKVVCYLDLKPTDIYSLSFTKPKKLFNDRMNDYFYLTQVSNYKAGELTKCEFIRL